MMRPGEARQDQRVRHDHTGQRGTIISVFEEPGWKRDPVDYATVRFDDGTVRDHPTFNLTAT